MTFMYRYVINVFCLLLVLTIQCQLYCIYKTLSGAVNILLFLQKIQIWLKSKNGPIEVFLCPDDTGNANGSKYESSPIKSHDESSNISFTSSEDSRDSFRSE